MVKSFIVTGASRGIGKHIAERLISEGNHVIGMGRHFAWDSPHLNPISIDFKDFKKLKEMLETLKKEIAQISGIICCAGAGKFGSLEQFSYDQIRELMDLNFVSQACVLKAFLPLLKQQESGDIILIGSEAALAGKKQGSIYCASKFALRGLSQALREECASSSVRITLINPGMVKTNFFDELSFSCGEEEVEHILPEDVADMVLYILKTRKGTVFEEINVAPQKKKIIFKKFTNQ